jgi:hypothetical protein
VVIAGLVVVGPALAASGVFNTGSTVPPAKRQVATVGNGVALRSGVELTALRVADPDGGPAWGLRLTDTSRGELCPVVGRVEHGQIGALGVDGAFHNDGLFHPYAADYPNYTFDGMSCAPADAQGHGFVFDTWFGAPTSASLRGESFHGVPCFGRWNEPASIRTLHRRSGVGHLKQAVCPADEVRDIYFGLLGPDARQIAYRSANGHLNTEAVGADGAYLVVLAHSPRNDPGTGSGPGPNNPPIVGIAMRSGDNCGELGPQHPPRPLSDCTLKGFSAPTVSTPSHAAVGSPITVAAAPRKYQPLAISVSFIARVAIHNTRSYYAVSVTDPPHNDPGAPSDLRCGPPGGSGSASDSDVMAGQRLKLTMDTSGLCYGVAHGVVEYVIDRGAQDGHPRAIPSALVNRFSRLYTVRIVGRFSYNVPRSKVSP